MSELGKLQPPYPVTKCALVGCQKPLYVADGNRWEDAYLFKDLDTDKLVVFCEDTARWVELHHHQRFVLVPL